MESSESEERDRRRSAGAANFWNVADVLVRNAVQLGIAVVLARLLSPEAFGAAAIAAFFAVFLSSLAQHGFSTAIIQRRSDQAEASELFWFMLAVSALLAGLLVLAGPALAAYFEVAELRYLVWFAAMQVVASAAGAVQTAMLSRSFRFRDLALAGLPATIIAGAVAIWLAASGAGLYALAAQTSLAAAITTLLVWWRCEFRPSPPSWRLPSRSILSFSGWLSASSSLELLYTQGSGLLIAKFHGVADLGLYNRAASTQAVPAMTISVIINRICLPLLAEATDLVSRRELFLSASRLAMLFNLPLLVGLAATADLVIEILYGSNWAGAAPVLAILALAGALYPIHNINLQLLLAEGRSDLYFRAEVIKKVVGAVLLVGGSIFGLMGLALATLVFSIVALFINVAPVRTLIGSGIIEQAQNLSGILVATLAMAAMVAAARTLLDLGSAAELAVVVVLGAATYLLAAHLLRLRAYTELRSFIVPLIGRVN